MGNKQILKDIVRQQIKNRRKQYTSLKFLTALLCFFLTSICVILYNEMQIIGNGREFEYVVCGMFFLVFLFFFSFYSIAYLNFSREKKNYDSLMKIGVTRRELKKSMKYFGRYLAGGLLLISGSLGTCLGLAITWKYKTFTSILLSGFVIIIIYNCIQMALKLCMSKLIKSFKLKDKRNCKKEKYSTDRLNIFTMAIKYLSYNAVRTSFVFIVLLFSGILLCFAFSTTKSIDIDKYMSDNWGKQDYKIILNKEGDTTGEYHLLQIDNPLTSELQKVILSIDGIEKVIPKLSMSTSFQLGKEKISTSLNSLTNGVLKNSGLEHIAEDEVIISTNESLLKDGEKN